VLPSAIEGEDSLKKKKKKTRNNKIAANYKLVDTRIHSPSLLMIEPGKMLCVCAETLIQAFARLFSSSIANVSALLRSFDSKNTFTLRKETNSLPSPTVPKEKSTA